MEAKRTVGAEWLVVVLIALPACYVASYCALLHGTQTMLTDPARTSLPRYRIEGEVVEQVLYPVHWLDRHVRVSYWQWDEGELSHYCDGCGDGEIDEPDIEPLSSKSE